MDSESSLEARIAASMAQSSPKQKQLARFVLGNRYLVSFASASQVGQAVGASAATVVRFAQSLGYAGFSELQEAIRKELPTYLSAVDRIQKRLDAPLPTDGIPQQVFHADIKNIQRTAASLSEAEFNAALDKIVKARRIMVVGSGLSSAPAIFLAHSLRVIGFSAQEAIDGGLFQAVNAAQLGTGMLLIAIDLWRYARSTVEAVHTAKRQGASVITISDSIVSPMAQVADHAFAVVTDGVSHSLSLTAVISLLNGIIAALSYRAPEQTVESLRRVDAAYRTGNLLLTE